MDSQPSVARSGRICDALPPRRSPRKINRSFKRGSGGAGRSQSGGRWAPGLGWRRAGAAIQQRRPSLTAARRGREQAKNRISERMFHVKHPFRNEAYSSGSTPPPPAKKPHAHPACDVKAAAPENPRGVIYYLFDHGQDRSPMACFLQPHPGVFRKKPGREKQSANQAPRIAP